jgi:hypothetical protein
MSCCSFKTFCHWILEWISFLCLWFLFALAYLAFNDGHFMDKVRYWPFFAWLIIHPTYGVVNYQSPERRCLKHQNGPEKMKENMEKDFYSAPDITMEVECYHIEDCCGKSRKKVTTSCESQTFEYSTWRDISGRLRLDNGWEIFRCWKYYVLLELEYEVVFADKQTLSDYEKQKQILIKKNMKKDKKYCYKKRTYMREGSGNFTTFNLIKISDKEPLLKCLFSECIFIIFCCILPFSQIYKFFLNLYLIRKRFVIKKVISTTLDLNSEEFRTKYEKFNPCVIIGKEEYLFTGRPKPKVYDLEFTTYKNEHESDESYIEKTTTDVPLNENLINDIL